ncbi:MAG: hypothetical protein ACYSTY_12175, partial [Planctomycetota bacterium]
MGIYVARFEHIRRAIAAVPEEGQLFCFFAIDDRPSHRRLLGYIESIESWIDQLSAASGIYSFIPASKWRTTKADPDFMGEERML